MLSLEINFLANPKSIKFTLFSEYDLMQKLEGFISRWMKFLLWINSQMVIICYAKNNTVFKGNFLPFFMNRLLRDGPICYITNTL